MAVAIFVILYTIFNAIGISDGILSFPFPDSIVFNRMTFFDPNFINPTQVNGGAAPVALLQSTISSLYYTFFILALTVFVIAAMIIGIKLAISSIASEKAQYKQALNNWVFGIVLLFTVHFLMAGIFTLNEAIVEIAYDLADTIPFELPVLEMIPVAGNALHNIFGTVTDFISGITGGIVDIPDPSITVTGYMGLILIYLVQALSGDFLSSLILFIIMGQTIALIVMYIRRLFYSIFLGMLAPLIVAVDVIRKSIS